MRTTIYLFAFIFLFSSCNQETLQKINLSGEWNFQVDSLDKGESDKWFASLLSETIILPGSMAENGKGNNITMNTKWTGGVRNPEWHTNENYAPYHDPENIRFPYWLQPVKKYTGAAWYQKEINIPEDWSQKDVVLTLERCHWETSVWLDDQHLGTQNSLAAPHYYSLPEQTSSGKHTLTIRVDNRTKDVDVGRNSHSISDHTQSNWNGIVGEISLQAKERISIKKVQIFPDVLTKSVAVKAIIQNGGNKAQKSTLFLSAKGILPNEYSAKTKKQSVELNPGENVIELNYELGNDARFWDEFTQNIYELILTVQSTEIKTSKTETFGLREIKAKNGELTINGRKLFLRGTLECAIFPKTGYPPTDTKEWKRIYKVIKAHGLNHMRFHSWCPPEAAFIAADQQGIYLQVECSSWANGSTTLGDGKPIDQYIWDESKRIVNEYGNHPSFIMMAYGNEPGGRNHPQFLAEFVDHWKKEDGRRLYTSAAGWPAIPENDFHNIPQPRIQGWGQGLRSIINAEPPKTDYDWHNRNKMPKDSIPVVSHEIGQWCVYPNFKEIEKYTGVLKAKNFELFRESLEANHMRHLADSFLLASGKLQALCYKADIEAAIRTKDFGGFQLLDLHDFPGQGTALVGILDPFWEQKGYISPKEFSKFCNSVVPLVRLSKHVFTEGETMTTKVEVANFAASELKSVNPKWKLSDKTGNILGQGTLGSRNIPIGNCIDLGTIKYQFQKTGKADQLKLTVGIEKFTNSWDIWVYPKAPVTKSEIIITEQFDNKTIQQLNAGAKVLLSLGKGKVREGKGGEVGVGFSSIFWNTAWTDGQKPHTLGILCNPEHPALNEFPTEYHSNWQWWDAMSHSDVLKINGLSTELRPIVRVIDDWVSNRRLALLFEVKIGKGKLLVSGIDLHSDLEQRPEARQLRSSLINYMTSEKFNPLTKLEVEQIQQFIR